MNKYKIQHRIRTISKIYILENHSEASFKVDGIKFLEHDFNIKDGAKSDSWIAEYEFEGNSFEKEVAVFLRKLHKIIPILSFITQGYVEFLNQPFLITKENESIGFLKYRKASEPVGLSFNEKEKKALKDILKEEKNLDAFFLYWNAATNTIENSAKLLLMFAALEAFVGKNEDGKKDYSLMIKVLGKELKEEIFGKANESNKNAFRNRLAHGEWMERVDTQKNYVETIHKKVVKYFNENIFNKDNLLSNEIAFPQRNFSGIYKGANWFIERNDKEELKFKEVLRDFDNNEFQEEEFHKRVIYKVEDF